MSPTRATTAFVPSSRRHWHILLAVAAATMGALTVYELLKQLLLPSLSPWQSHAMTIVLGTVGAMAAVHFALRREAEQAHTIRMLAQTARSMSESVTITDMEDRLILVNPAFERMYGYDAASVIGQSITILRSSRNDEASVRQILPATISGGWTGEVWNRRRDGTEFLVSLSTAMVRDDAGRPVALVGVGRDITDQRATEQAAREGLKWESIATLAGGVAHNFNNLLHRIVGHTTLVRDALPADHAAQTDLAEALRASEAAARLTSQLLAYSRQGYFHIDRVDLNQEVRSGVARIRGQVAADVALDAELTGAPLLVDADRPQIQQVLFSLIFNAVEAMDARTGRILLRTATEHVGASAGTAWKTLGEPLPQGRYAILEVSDTGRGMDEATLDRIFDPFFSTKFTGRGLGLAAVLGIVLRHHGGLQVASTPGVGTTFRLALPIASQPLAS